MSTVKRAQVRGHRRFPTKGVTMAGGWMDKIKDLAKGNPQQAESAIDRVEDLIDERTGGKYADQVDKGGDSLRDQLGLPEESPAPAPAPAPEPAPTPAPEPAPAPAPEPAPAPAPEPTPAPNPSPSTGDPQDPATGDGPLTPGEPQQPGQPGGPLDPSQRPDGGPAQVPTDEPGSSNIPSPGPDAETTVGDEGTKELPPFGRS
jgi:hypothetical protein